MGEENMLLLRYRLKGESISVTGKNLPPPKITSSHDDAQLSDHAVAQKTKKIKKQRRNNKRTQNNYGVIGELGIIVT